MKSLWRRIQAQLMALLDFQGRIWVVNIYEERGQGGSFILSEDSFTEELQWMKRKGYDEMMLTQVQSMQRSQVLQFELSTAKHRLLRIK
jgi:hypothetical protein